MLKIRRKIFSRSSVFATRSFWKSPWAIMAMAQNWSLSTPRISLTFAPTRLLGMSFPSGIRREASGSCITMPRFFCLEGRS